MNQYDLLGLKMGLKITAKLNARLQKTISSEMGDSQEIENQHHLMTRLRDYINNGYMDH